MPAVKNLLDPWITLGEEPGVAPAHLEAVRALLNTDDRFHGVDRLPQDAPAPVRALRDAVRAFVEGDGRPLDALAKDHPLLVAIADGSARLVPARSDDGVAPVLAAVLDASRTGDWARLKACANPGCQWVYYDASRNRSGRWCSMAECGDVMKARAYRERSRVR